MRNFHKKIEDNEMERRVVVNTLGILGIFENLLCVFLKKHLPNPKLLQVFF